MSVTAERVNEHMTTIEQLVDSGFEAAASTLDSLQKWTKVLIMAPYGYSAAAEAANALARARRAGAHASTDG